MSRIAVQVPLIQAMNTSLADAVVDVVFEDNVAGYDTVSGAVTPGLTFNNRGIRYDFEQEEIDNESLLQTDIKLIIVQSEYAVIPQIDWFCTIDGDKYQVIRFIEDPFKATAEYQLRLK